MSALRFGIVVVHWRGLDDLLECLASLRQIDTPNVEIVIALNTRDDFDEDAVRAACPGAIIAESAENLGYAGGCNTGWRALRDRGLDAILFLNNDVVVSPDIITRISAIFADASVGVAGTAVTYYDDPTRIWFGGGIINRTFGYTRHANFGAVGSVGAVDAAATGGGVDFINGCAIAVRTDVLDRLGGWDEAYFHFFDEVDLCERARAAGYTSWLDATPAVRHKVSASTGVRGSNQFNRGQAYYFCRNRVRFVRRNYRGWRRVTALFAQPALVAYECAQALSARRTSEARGRIEGLIDGLRNRSGKRGDSA